MRKSIAVSADKKQSAVDSSAPLKALASGPQALQSLMLYWDVLLWSTAADLDKFWSLNQHMNLLYSEKKKNLFQMPVLTHFRKLLSGSAVLQSRASQCSISLWSAANPDSGFSPSPSFKVVKIGIWPYQYFSSSSVYSSSPLPCFPFLCPRKNTAIIAIFVAPALSELL